MKATLVAFFLLTILHVEAQLPVKGFTLTDVITESPVALDNYVSSPGVVILFTSNDCPYDIAYAERIGALIKKYATQIPFLMINAHLDPEESAEKMKAKAATWGFTVPYLADKDQLAMSGLGAKRSPEVFLLRQEKGNFVILYSGAIDDNPQEPAAVTHQHLQNALDNLLAGKPGKHSQQRAVGCSIRKK